ncbi:hypothetical protein KIPB_006587 [Kipferlia bialata]|uniref:Transmembrane protein n=1 Tax=Kipferlia bialata TaxID=797122 RepID=A0A9K3CZV9_9EUKA|nr:hypothetical protein KIPB_006587 [Kipferlia bialata]|eukprot:g6587.t1
MKEEEFQYNRHRERPSSDLLTSDVVGDQTESKARHSKQMSKLSYLGCGCLCSGRNRNRDRKRIQFVEMIVVVMCLGFAGTIGYGTLVGSVWNEAAYPYLWLRLLLSLPVLYCVGMFIWYYALVVITPAGSPPLASEAAEHGQSGSQDWDQCTKCDK